MQQPINKVSIARTHVRALSRERKSARTPVRVLKNNVELHESTFCRYEKRLNIEGTRGQHGCLDAAVLPTLRPLSPGEW